MQARIDGWVKKGGKKDRLWESVKGAEKREGVVVCAEYVKEEDRDGRADGHGETCKAEEIRLMASVRSKKSKADREAERLNTQLDDVVQSREEIKKGMEVVLWRERLIELAAERAESVGQCGWDQRLCFGDEEWADFGAGVLESYEESGGADGVKQEGDDAIQVDGAAEGDGEWWCVGKKMCERHAG